LYALGALTRPDGLLFAASALAAAAAVLAARRALSLRWLAAQAAGFLPLVAAQLLWRRGYYGEWLPNTFYVKVDGTWWGMGGAYLASAALEYAVWLWPPLLVLAVKRHARLGGLHVPLLFAAVVLPHALYVAAIGGDHFEYRPLDLYFPFVFLLLGDGVFELARTRRGTWLAPASAALLIAGLVAIPWRSHVESPDHYEVGFPGLPEGPSGAARAEFLDPARNPIYRWPGLRQLAEWHRAFLQDTTEHFVGVRQEEHRHFLLTVLPEARRLADLRERGVLPADAYFAISCVGAIPYYSGLRTLDRYGLTDAVVARGPARGQAMLAHDKHATLQYAARAGVDFWALDEVHSLWPLEDPRLPAYLAGARGSRVPVHVAYVGGDAILLGVLPRGPEAAALRFPELHFAPIGNEAVYGDLMGRIDSARARSAR
jgi:arabinofuranosyltransferase